MSAYDEFERKAASYRARFSIDPGQPFGPQKVRPYTTAEKAFVEAEPLSQEERLLRILGKIQIDNSRYSTARYDHPEMTNHFTRLIRAGVTSMEPWIEHFEAEHSVDTSSVVIPFNGREFVGLVQFPARPMVGCISVYQPQFDKQR